MLMPGISCNKGTAVSYSLVAVFLRQRLADELAGPLVRLVARVTHQSWNDERHSSGG